jgi:hypothetical protein
MGKPINIDEDIEDADWTKGTWDLTHSPEETAAYAAEIRLWTVEQARAFADLPCYRAAPAEVKAAVEARLASR